MSPLHIALRASSAFVVTLALAAPAYAGNSADEAAAEVLFTDAQKLAHAGNFAEACPKFEESQRLDAGAGTLLNLGACYEAQGRLASAFGAYKEAEVTARNANDAKRQAEAARRAEGLALKLPRLVLLVPPAARVPGLEVKRNGAIVGEGQWGSGVPVDPGDNTIEVTAPGYKSWSSLVHIDAHPGAAQIEIPLLEKGSFDSAPAKAGFTWSAQRSVGVALGAIGLAGLGVAAGFTVNAATKNAASLVHCPTSPTKCDATGVDLRNQAFDAAHVGTGAVIAGAVAAAAGLTVFLTASNGSAKKSEHPALRVEVHTTVSRGIAALSLAGAW